METNFISAGGRLWLYAGPPDTSVHNSFGAYADRGEYFMNTLTQILYFCTVGGVTQTWTQVTYMSQVQSLISAIPAQIQSDYGQTNNTALDYIKNKPSAPSSSTVSRALNTIFQISANRNAWASYSIDITTSLSLVAGASGSVIFETASNSAFTLNVESIASSSNGNTGALAVGLNLTQLSTANLHDLLQLDIMLD